MCTLYLLDAVAIDTIYSDEVFLEKPDTARSTWKWLAGVNRHDPGDGVVPYASAHLDGVDSEQVVAADHFHVHQHPLAVREVRRILLEHANDVTTKDTKNTK